MSKTIYFSFEKYSLKLAKPFVCLVNMWIVPCDPGLTSDPGHLADKLKCKFCSLPAITLSNIKCLKISIFCKVLINFRHILSLAGSPLRPVHCFEVNFYYRTSRESPNS